VDVSNKEIVLGSKKIITVYDGEVGVCYDKGKLRVLDPDRHILDSADQVFLGFLSTQQQCLPLVVQSGKNKYEKDGYLICETKDFVEIGLRADVFYKIEDSSKVLFHVGKDKIEPLVKDTAIATLNSIIRSTSLSQIAQNKEITVEQSKNVQAPQFYEKLHDEFIGKLREGFLHEFGIDIKKHSY